MNVGNLEVLQSSTDGGSNFLVVVGVDAFELLHKSFELLDRTSVVTGRDAELLDICVFVIREFNRVGVGGCEPVVPAFVEPWVLSPVPAASPISTADLSVAESKKSAGESTLADWPEATELLSSSNALVKA